MDSNEEFFKALAALQPIATKNIEFRIYYDKDTGEILNYTNDDLDGDYISVDRETFARHRFDCLVKDGRLVPFKLPRAKLAPASEGRPCDPRDITIIVPPEVPAQYWKMTTYED